MQVKTILIMTSLITLGTLENAFPFFRYRQPLDQRMIINLSLGVINTLLLTVPLSFLLQLIWQQTVWSGFLTALAPILPRIILTCLILDLYLYSWHRLMHSTPWGWRLHWLHHTETNLNVSSAYRFHGLEVLLSNIPKLGIIFLMGIDQSALLVYESLFAVSLIFHHSNWALPYNLDRFLSNSIVTPNYHRHHHSQRFQDMRSNYASLLTLWDRLFGTDAYPQAPRTIQLGTSQNQQTSFTLWQLLVSYPFRILCQ
jgi:sterol desaturase/sphingolipid hydroxylase (fatty acid hydroxylase superfamily)